MSVLLRLLDGMDGMEGMEGSDGKLPDGVYHAVSVSFITLCSLNQVMLCSFESDYCP